MQACVKLWEINIRPAFTAVIAPIHDAAVNGVLKRKRTGVCIRNIRMFWKGNSVISLWTRNIG